MGDRVPHHAESRRGRLGAPELLDQALRRQRLVRVHEQQRKQRLPRTAERESGAVVNRLHGTENPELQADYLAMTPIVTSSEHSVPR